MIQLGPEEGVQLQITSFNNFGFSINNNIRVVGPIAIFPKTIYSWNVGGLSEVNEKSLSLFKLIEPRLGFYLVFLFLKLYYLKIICKTIISHKKIFS
jgi:NADH dehydrogenase [ubiquinone] 1 alpha subcomplex assembly factor 3